MKVLNIVSTGYRATLEEQDDTILWLTQALRRAGAEIDVLLRSSATAYVVDGQSVAPLAIGGRAQRHAPDVHGQVEDLARSGAAIFVLDQDLERYGLRDCARLAQAQVVGPDELTGLLTRYDAVWHW